MGRLSGTTTTSATTTGLTTGGGRLGGGRLGKPEEKEEEKKGVLAAAVDIAKEIVLTPARVAVAPLGLIESGVRELKGEEETAGPLHRFAFKGAEPGTKQETAAAAERAFDALTFGIGGSVLSGLSKQAMKKLAAETGKEAAKVTFKQIGKEAFTKGGMKIIAKNTLIDAGFGAGYGLAHLEQVTEEETTNIQKARAVLTGAALGAAFPPLFEIGIRGTGLVGQSIFRRIGAGLEVAARTLEKRVQVAEKGAIKKPWHLPGANVPTRTFKTSIEMKAAAAIRRLQRIDFDIRRGVFKEAKVEKTFGRLENQKKVAPGKALAVTETVQRASARAQARTFGTPAVPGAIPKFYRNVTDNYGLEVHELANQYEKYLDNIDRIRRGQSIEVGMDEKQLLGRFTLLRKEIRDKGPEFEKQVRARMRDKQLILRRMLKEMRDTGRISKEEYGRILAAHPNYHPHRIADYFRREISPEEAQAFASYSREFKPKKAVGSERERIPMDEEFIEYVTRETFLNERKKALNAFNKAVRGLEDEVGLQRVTTREQKVKFRDTLQALKTRIEETKVAMRTERGERKFTKAQQRTLKKLEDEYDNTIKTLREDLSTYLSGEDSRFVMGAVPQRTPRAIPAGTFPQELLHWAKYAADYNSYDEFQKSPLYTKLIAEVAGGTFERNGYKGAEKQALKNFFKDVKSAVDEVAGPRVKTRGVSAGVLARGAKAEAKLFRREGEQRIITESAEDALKLAKRELDFLKEEKVRLRKELDKLRPDKIKAVDVPEGKTKMRFVNDGVVEDWIIDTDLKRALFSVGHPAIEKAIAWLTQTKMGRFLTTPARTVKTFATEKNPAFFLVNPIRDVQEAKMMSEVTGLDMAKSVGDLIAGMRGKTLDGDDMRHLQEATRLGVIRAGFLASENNSKDVTLRVLQEVGLTSKTLPQKGLKVLDGVEQMGLLTEQMVRLAVFSNARNKGLSPLEAARLASDATVDFSRRGDVTHLLNLIIPYFNAGTQGTLRFARFLKKDPQAIARKSMYFVGVPAMILASWNSRYQEGYDNIPEVDKRMNWIIMAGQVPGRSAEGKPFMIPHYIKIPKGFAQQLITYPLENMIDKGLHNEATQQDTLDFLAGWATISTPLDLTDDYGNASVTGALAGTGGSLTPSGLKMPLELLTNYSFFRGKPIIDDWLLKRDPKTGREKWFKKDELDPEEQHSDAKTSEVAQLLGKALNLSPAQIDHMIQTGVGVDLVKMIDSTILLSEDEKNQLYKQRFGREPTSLEKVSMFPFLRKFVGTSYYGGVWKQMEKERMEAKERAKVKLQRLKRD